MGINANDGFARSHLSVSLRWLARSRCTPMRRKPVCRWRTLTGLHCIPKLMDFVLKTMDLVLKTMDFVLKSMDLVLKTMDCIPTIMGFMLKTMELPL